MNFNATRVGPAKKVKRVSDTAAMGTPLPSSPPPVYSPYDNAYMMGEGQPAQQSYFQSPQMAHMQSTPQMPQMQSTPQTQPFSSPIYTPGMNPYQVFNAPIVQDVARQYGQQLANQGKEMVDREINKYIPVSQLKVYFAVSNSYVLKKMQLIFVPFFHKDWSIPYSEAYPSQPRNAVNMPDLYIPAMAYITFVLFAGFILGMQKRFTPELIGIVASSCLAYSLLEMLAYKLIMYIYHISTNIKLLDLFSSCGYKYPVLIVCVLANVLLNRSWYYACLAYCGLALSFFLVRSLKYQMFVSTNAYGDTSGYQDTAGHSMRRGFYFLLFVAGIQPLLLWLFSYELVYGAKNEI